MKPSKTLYEKNNKKNNLVKIFYIPNKIYNYNFIKTNSVRMYVH